MQVLITGTSGFIGYHLALRLLGEGHGVTGYDGMTPYYDIRLKARRRARLAAFPGFSDVTAMLEDGASLARTVAAARADTVIHLAAQAGVRYSLENPAAYAGANLTGSFNLLEALRAAPPRHLLLASTSSVYGAATRVPFAETDRTDEPLTLYAATKKAMEVMAHAHAHLWAIPTTVFRFFTVYGPWGRPDMALFRFVAAILRDEPVEVYGEGRMARDFTYVDDLVEAVRRLIDVVPGTAPPVTGPGVADTLSPVAPYRVVNIGGGQPVALPDFLAVIEEVLGRPARRRLLPMQKGDVPRTWASPALLRALTGAVPATPLAEGVRAFVDWYRAEEMPGRR